MLKEKNILNKAAEYSSELEKALHYWKESSFLFGVIDNKDKADLSAEVSQMPLTANPFTTITTDKDE